MTLIAYLEFIHMRLFQSKEAIINNRLDKDTKVVYKDMIHSNRGMVKVGGSYYEKEN